MKNKPKNLIKSLDRALNILELITNNKQAISISEISTETGLHKSTVHRILSTLKYRGYTAQKENNNKYTTGIKLIELGSLVINQLNLRKTVLPYMENLMELTGETIHLGILNDDLEVIYIEKVEGSQTIRMHSQIGKRAPSYSTSLGKVLLAFRYGADIDHIFKESDLIAKTSNTITSLSKLKDQMNLIKKRGYSIDNCENEEEIRCIAGPIFNHKNKITAAFSVSGPANRLTMEKINSSYKKFILEYSQNISKELGSNNFLD